MDSNGIETLQMMKKVGYKQDDETVNIVLKNLTHKLEQRHIKVASIISKCEDYDVNGDGIIHVNDLEAVLNDIFGLHFFLRREIFVLIRVLPPRKDKNQVDYRKLLNLVDDAMNHPVSEGEYWYDPDEEAEKMARVKKGTVGEWLHHAACPAEIKNFKKFIASLEDFERSSGMKCIQTSDGFMVPLGPELKVSIKFFMD